MSLKMPNYRTIRHFSQIPKGKKQFFSYLEKI